MPVQEDDFYNASLPSFAQQGDIFPDVPLLGLPPSQHLVVLRTVGTRTPWEPQTGVVEALSELAVTSFADGRPEHIVASARRGMAVLVTQTCNLDDSDYWLVSPAYVVEGTAIKRKELFDGKYPNLFGLFNHPDGYFPESYIDLSDIRPIHKASVELADRIACLSQSAQYSLADRIASALTREWGFREGEVVHETGRYRCRQCNRYDIEITDQDFKAGEKFTACSGCRKIHKTEQWYLLMKHKRS